MWVHCVSLTEYPGVNTGDTIIALTDCMVWKHRWTLNKALLPFCCCSVVKSCPTLCNPIDCSKPASSVLYYLPEFTQIHVHWVGDAILSSYPLPYPSFAFNLFQQQGFIFPMSWLFTSDGWTIGTSASASVLPMNIYIWFPLGLLHYRGTECHKGITDAIMTMIYGKAVNATEERIPKIVTSNLRPEGKAGFRQGEVTIHNHPVKHEKKTEMRKSELKQRQYVVYRGSRRQC